MVVNFVFNCCRNESWLDISDRNTRDFQQFNHVLGLKNVSDDLSEITYYGLQIYICRDDYLWVIVIVTIESRIRSICKWSICKFFQIVPNSYLHEVAIHYRWYLCKVMLSIYIYFSDDLCIHYT